MSVHRELKIARERRHPVSIACRGGSEYRNMVVCFDDGELVELRSPDGNLRAKVFLSDIIGVKEEV